MKASRATTWGLCTVVLLSSLGRLAAQNLPVMNGLQLWLDATDPSTLFEDDFLRNPIDPNNIGGPVGGWKDKSPNGHEVFQFDLVRQPTYQADVMNGLPAVRFDGSDGDGMEIFAFELSRPYTVFIVNQYWGNIRGRTLQSTDINWLHGLWAGHVASYANGWVSDSANMPATNNVPYVADTVGTATSTSFFLNGQDFTVNSMPTGVPGGLGLGTVGMFPAEASDADISEVIIYDRALGQNELDSMRTFLYDKYGAEPYTLPPPDPFSVQFGTVGQFTGADPSESRNVVEWNWTAETGPVYTFADAAGLDFEGNFVQAINVGGPGLLTVGDVQFKNGSEAGFDNPGVFITDANEILNWNTPAFGDSPGDNALEVVMQSIRWNVPPGLNIDIPVEQGNYYKLQMLFMEACCNRGFDIFLEGEEAVSNLIVQQVQEGINNPAAAVFYTHTFQAQDAVLNILLGGQHLTAPDNNPILSAVTLELVPPPPLGIPGDYNGSSVVEQGDLDLTLLNWGTTLQNPQGIGWVNDLPNGLIDQEELDKVLLNWGNAAPLGAASVPEPGSLILGLIMLVLFAWRRSQGRLSPGVLPMPAG